MKRRIGKRTKKSHGIRLARYLKSKKEGPSEHCYACDRCFGTTNGTRKSRHHIYPKRFFGGGGPTVPLCEECHRILEQKWIPPFQQLTREQYRQVLAFFCETRRIKRS